MSRPPGDLTQNKPQHLNCGWKGKKKIRGGGVNYPYFTQRALSWRTVWSLLLVFLAVMNSVLNPALHSALRCETQCHTPPSESRLGLQVASCLPVFLSSGTAGAINQPPPHCVCLWSDQKHNSTRASHRVLRGEGGEHFSPSFPYFQAFQDSHIWYFHAEGKLSVQSCQPIDSFGLSTSGLIFTLGHSVRGASDGSKLEYRSSSSSQHVQSQASLHLQMERIEGHYCVLGGASSSVNSLAHF